MSPAEVFPTKLGPAEAEAEADADAEPEDRAAPESVNVRRRWSLRLRRLQAKLPRGKVII